MGSEDEYWQGRIVDPTGTFFVYAGQYQPEAAEMLQETEPPAFGAVVGKPRTYETDDGTVNVPLHPEHLTIVDETTRNRWVTETAERTLDRIGALDDGTNEYARMAHEKYGSDVELYRQAVIEAVESLDTASADTGDAPTENANENEDEDGDGDRDHQTTRDEKSNRAATSPTGSAADDLGEEESQDQDQDQNVSAESGETLGDFNADSDGTTTATDSGSTTDTGDSSSETD